MLRKLLTPKEVSALLQVEEKTLAQWRSSGLVDLPFIKLGGMVRYEEEAIARFIDGRRRGHT
jgi:predicted site-specific integrase-resolvase